MADDKEAILAKTHLHSVHSIKTESDPISYPYIYSEYRKIPQPPTLEMQIRRIRSLLENWKHILLHANNVLMWEHHWHPSAIICGTTIIFTVLWLMDPSTLTILSTIGLIITVADYIVPSISSSIFKHDLTEEQQQQFDDICTNIVLIKAKGELLFSSFFKMRIKNPKLYIIITFCTLSLLAWIGASINNLFLTYILVTFILLLPGLERKGALDKWTGILSKIYTDLVENAKARVTQTKKVQ